MSTAFEAGQQVRCIRPHDYNFTMNKVYTVVDYEPPAYAGNGSGYTWPAYLHLVDDSGELTACHAIRFVSA